MPNHLDRADASLRFRQRLAGEDRARGGLSIEHVGLAVPATGASVGAVDFQDMMPCLAQGTGKTSPIRPGSFDTEGRHGAEGAGPRVEEWYPTRLTGTIVAPRRTPNAFRATAARVSLCISIPMMILRLGASCKSGLLWRVLGPGAREGGQDCDGISPSSSYQVTHPTIGGSCPRGRKINARTRGQS